MAEADAPFFALVHSYDMHARYWKPSPLGSVVPELGLARSLVLQATSAELVIDGRVTPQGCFPILANGNARIRIDEDDPAEPLIAECLAAQVPASESDLAAVRDAYDGAARWADAQLGVLLAGLEEQGRLADSWIVVLADHGESLGEDGTFGHRHTIADDVVHVPLLVRPPGGVPGRHVGGVAELTDVTATLLAIAGAQAPSGLRGISLLPAIDGADGVGREHAITESWAQATRITSARGTYLAFEGLGWDNPTWSELLRWAPAGGPSLRASRVDDRGELERLRAELLAWRLSVPVAPRPTSTPDPRYEEALRTSGYWTP
jgi:hypothetical protein